MGDAPIDTERLDYVLLINRIIEKGCATVERDYVYDEKKRRGALAGFRSCTNKTPAELALHLQEANERSAQKVGTLDGEEWNEDVIGDWPYWYARCFALEVEWLCNVVSVWLMAQQRPMIIPPTARAVLFYHELSQEYANG